MSESGRTVRRQLWLARHAQPLIAPGVCYGQLDMAADAFPTAECALALARALPAGLRVMSSPLQRCEQLAQALRALRPDLAYKTDARLQEMAFGQWEGRAWQAIDPAELAAWTDDFANFQAGHSGESVTAFMARVGAAFDYAVDYPCRRHPRRHAAGARRAPHQRSQPMAAGRAEIWTMANT